MVLTELENAFIILELCVNDQGQTNHEADNNDDSTDFHTGEDLHGIIAGTPLAFGEGDTKGRIDDQVIQKVNEARNTQKPRLQVRRWAAFEACFVLILSMALTAEATNGTVSNLLAPLFGGAQTEIVDEIGVPIGASTSVNGYADSRCHYRRPLQCYDCIHPYKGGRTTDPGKY